MTHAKIIGTGKYLPKRVLDNEFFVKRNPWNKYDLDGEFVEEIILTDEKIQQLSGIVERRRAAPNQYSHHLGAKASKIALKNAGIKAEELEGIIAASVTPQSGFPSTANLIQEQIGAKNAGDVFDIAAACAGYPIALDIGNKYISSGSGYFLIIGVERLTKLEDYENDKDVNAFLFGDGAGAAVLAPTEEDIGIFASYTKSDPFDKKSHYIYKDEKGILRMPKGKQVFLYAGKSMLEAAAAVKEELGWKSEDVTLYIPHQANNRITDTVAKKIGEEKVFRNIKKYGNMSSATTAVGLAEAIEQGKIKDGSKVIMMAVGSGLMTSAVAIQF